MKQKTKTKKMTLWLIHWVDTSHIMGWNKVEYSLDWGKHLCSVFTVGWLLEKNKYHYVITPAFSPREDGNEDVSYNGCLVTYKIPIGCVKSKKRLGVYEINEYGIRQIK